MTTIGNIRNLTLLGAAALTLAATGCVVDATSSPGGSACANIAADWDIEQAQSLAQLSCAQAGATTVRMTANTMSMDFPCGDYTGISDAVFPGTYSISFDLLDPSGAQRAPTVGPMTFTIPGCGTLDLTAIEGGPVIFDVP